jgi:PDZ domain
VPCNKGEEIMMRSILGAALCVIAASAGFNQAAARGVLGLAAQDLPPNAGVRGAWVQEVLPGSAAEASGLKPNDVIVAVDGEPIDAASSLTAAIARHTEGETVTIIALRPSGRNLQKLTLSAKLNGAMGTRNAIPPENLQSIAVAASASGSDQWITFSDAREQAFTAEVPEGWQVEGGLVRHTPTDPSVFIRMMSPDHRTYLMVGDQNLTLYTTPGAGVAGGPATSRYLPGADFARAYVEHAMPSQCSNVVVTGQKVRPDLAQGPWTKVNPQARHDGGEATFTCKLGDVPAHGIVAAATYIYATPGNYGGNLWTADFLAGAVAAADHYDTAVEMLKHVVASIRINPDWMQRQQQMTALAARNLDVATQRNIQAARAMDQITQQQIAAGDRIHEAQQGRTHQFDQQQEAMGRIINGSSPYRDPLGNLHDMSNLPSGHWINSGGVTATTNGSSPPPGVGWQPMQEVLPQ